MAKTRKSAQRKRASKEANAANMAFLEEKTEAPQPGPSKKKEHALNTVFVVQNSSEDHPEPSNKKQRIEEDLPLQPMDLNYHEHCPKDMTVDQESLAEIEFDIVDKDATDPLEVSQQANGSSTNIQLGEENVVHVEQIATAATVKLHSESGGSPRDSEITNAVNNKPVDPSQDSHAQCNAQIESLQKRIAELDAENTTQKDEISMLKRQNWKLQCKIVEDTSKRTSFTTATNTTGYPSPEWLLQASKVAKDSDYMFVKELMVYLWPNGVGRATTTGRSSNNPSGSKKSLETTPDETTETSNESTLDSLAKLDPEKVKFIKASLLQRREILDDDYGVARALADKTVQHINRVLSNNPSMKSITDKRVN